MGGLENDFNVPQNFEIESIAQYSSGNSIRANQRSEMSRQLQCIAELFFWSRHSGSSATTLEDTLWLASSFSSSSSITDAGPGLMNDLIIKFNFLAYTLASYNEASCH